MVEKRKEKIDLLKKLLTGQKSISDMEQAQLIGPIPSWVVSDNDGDIKRLKTIYGPIIKKGDKFYTIGGKSISPGWFPDEI